MICDFALLLGFIAETHEIRHTIIKQVMEELNLHTSKKFMHRYRHQKQDTTMVHGNGFMRLKRWAWVGALAAFILLGAGIILQNSPWSEKLKEYTTRSVQSPPVVLPQSPAFREPPLLPQSPAFREPPPSLR